MKTNSKINKAIKGGATVAVMSDLSWEEHLIIYYFRCCFEGSEAILAVHKEFSFYLGEEKADKTLGALQFLFSKLQNYGRRRLAGHDLNCESVGADENCFAQLITRSTYEDKKDAILIGILLSDSDLAPELVYAAEDFAIGVQALLKIIDDITRNNENKRKTLYN